MSGEFWMAYFWLHHNKCLVLALFRNMFLLSIPGVLLLSHVLKLLTCLFADPYTSINIFTCAMMGKWGGFANQKIIMNFLIRPIQTPISFWNDDK
jgi:hypothetical protein